MTPGEIAILITENINTSKGLLFEISLAGPQASTNPDRYSYILFKLAGIKQEFQNANPEQQRELAKEALQLVVSAGEDGLIDYNQGVRWLQNALPGAIITT
jgi:hypothetical protein